MSEIDIDYQGLKNVAKNLDNASSDLENQSFTCSNLLMDQDAFGLMFAWAIPPFTLAITGLNTALNHLSAALTDASLDVSAMATEFENSDDDTSLVFNDSTRIFE